MATRRIDRGLVLSACIHAAAILWGAVSFAAKPLKPIETESMFVETLSMSDFSKMMAGARQAEQKPVPKPLVEKKAEPKTVENQTAPIFDKPEIVSALASQDEPPPQIVPTPKPVPREARTEPPPPPQPQEPVKKPVEKQPEKQPEKIDAEALKRAEKKAEKKDVKKTEPKKEVRHSPQKKPDPKKLAEKPPEPQPQPEKSQFSADQIQALLDKRQPRRLAATGDVLSQQPVLGAARGSAPELSQNEIDALRARIQQCWNPPAGQADARDLTVLVRIQFKPDGSLATEPRLISRVNPGYQQVAAESALRAIRRCAPYSFMPAAKYETWKDIEVNFDPRDLFRG